jgi:hypothetical protein
MEASASTSERDEGIDDKGDNFGVSWLRLSQSSWDKFIHVHHKIHDCHTYDQLQANLIGHQWALIEKE